jgi:hypothetical protein
MRAELTVPSTLLGICLLASLALPDTWPAPKAQTYCSSNGKYCLDVRPKIIESEGQYLDDKAKSLHHHGSTDQSANDNYCRGVLYEKGVADGSRNIIWSTHLSNEVSPLRALVSNDGRSVVTFDNWPFVGFGDNVVAIYGPSGQRVKKMALAEIASGSEISKMPRSVSSIYWGGAHYIDEENHFLVLKVASNWSGSVDDLPDYREVKVDLATGEILQTRIAKDLRGEMPAANRQ